MLDLIAHSVPQKDTRIWNFQCLKSLWYRDVFPTAYFGCSLPNFAKLSTAILPFLWILQVQFSVRSTWRRNESNSVAAWAGRSAVLSFISNNLLLICVRYRHSLLHYYLWHFMAVWQLHPKVAQIYVHNNSPTRHNLILTLTLLLNSMQMWTFN